MAARDKQALDEVTREWMSGSGISLITQTILRMLNILAEGYGQSFSITGAVRALESLSQDALKIKGNLEEVKGRLDREHFGLRPTEYAIIDALLSRPRSEWPAELLQEVERRGNPTGDDLWRVVIHWNRQPN